MSATAKHVQLQNAGQFHTLYFAQLGYATKTKRVFFFSSSLYYGIFLVSTKSIQDY